MQNKIPTYWIKKFKNSSSTVSKEHNNLIFINNRLVDLKNVSAMSSISTL